MSKLIDDTLKNPNGKYSRKSVQAFASFAVAVLYSIFIPIIWRLIFNELFIINEVVFLTFMGMSGYTLSMTLYDKIKTKQLANTDNTSDLDNETHSV